MERPDLFAPLSVKLPRNASIRTAGEHAELLFIRGLLYAKDNGNVGWIPSFDLQVVAVGLSRVEESVKALVDEELWAEGDGGWHIPSWDKWNRTDEDEAARALKRRDDAAKRKRAQREREKAATGQALIALIDSALESAPEAQNVTRDVTRDGRVTVTHVTDLEKEEEIEKEPSLREGVQPPLLGVVEPATAPPTRRPRSEPKEPKANPHAVADGIATDWYERNKTTSGQKFIAVREIVRPLVARGVAPQLLAAAMDAATADGFPISGGTLTTAMNRLTRSQTASQDPYGNVTPIRQSPATSRASEAFARAAAYVAEADAMEA